MRQIKNLFFATAVLAAGSSATADPVCDDLWFSRNFYFDRAGYCFGSVLGEEVFNNYGCTTQAPELTAEEKAIVKEIQNIESDVGCKLDTTERRPLDIPNLPLRRTLLDQPINEGFESGCIGYIGEPLPLRAGIAQDAPIVGYIQAGDHLNFSHVPPIGATGNLDYITAVYRDGALQPLLGWTSIEFSEKTCEGLAG